MWSTHYSRQITVKLDRFSRKPQTSNFMKLCPVATELSHADRHHEATSRFCKFVNTPKNGLVRCMTDHWTCSLVIPHDNEPAHSKACIMDHSTLHLVMF